jgi:hypothetical protein
MSASLPSDLEVERRVAEVRVAVLEATQHVRSPRRSTRYRITRNVIIATAAAALLTAGTIVAIRASQSDIETGVFCYPEPSLTGTPVVVQTGIGYTLDPIDGCTEAWSLGLFDDPQSEEHGHPVPDLAACTLPDGMAGVFPRPQGSSGTDFCAALGLADWDSD